MLCYSKFDDDDGAIIFSIERGNVGGDWMRDASTTSNIVKVILKNKEGVSEETSRKGKSGEEKKGKEMRKKRFSFQSTFFLAPLKQHSRFNIIRNKSSLIFIFDRSTAAAEQREVEHFGGGIKSNENNFPNF